MLNSLPFLQDPRRFLQSYFWGCNQGHKLSLRCRHQLEQIPADSQDAMGDCRTSEKIMDAESRLVHAARTLTAAAVAGPAVTASLNRFEAATATRLDPGQRHLVTVFAASGMLITAGIGPAGTGKTTAMRAYATVLHDAGHRLVPLAPPPTLQKRVLGRLAGQLTVPAGFDAPLPDDVIDAFEGR